MTCGVSEIRVIGIGNTDRGDDAVGIAAARAVAALELPDVCVQEVPDGGLDLLEVWHGARAVLIVDAMHSSASPGAVRRFDAHRAPLPSVWARTSSHTLGITEAVELGRLLDQLPPRVTVYGIEARCCEPGEELSAEAARGVCESVRLMVEEIGWLLSQAMPHA